MSSLPGDPGQFYSQSPADAAPVETASPEAASAQEFPVPAINPAPTATPATGTPSESILRQLSAVVAQRNKQRPAGSYVVELLDGGQSIMGAKVVEEAYELVGAVGAHPDGEHGVVHEAADLLFHVLVLLESVDVEWKYVEQELQQRFGISGRRPPS